MPRVLTQAHLEQFRNRLCDVAARLYFEMGHSDFNMRDLAARLGVSAMTPYRYFGDKEGILAAVRVRGVARLADQMEAALPGGLVAVMQAYIDFAMGEAAFYRLIFDLSQPQARLTELTGEEHRLRSVLASAAAAGRSKSDAEMLARSLWAGLHGAVCLAVAGKLSESELGELASRLAFVLLGIRCRFVVPALQASPPCEQSANSTQSALFVAPANIAAE